MDIKGKRVLITGGSSGIGFALATVLGHKRAQAVITGGEARSRMIAFNRDDPATLEARFAHIREALAEAARDHTAL